MSEPTPPIGSFEDAARANARRIAALTPAERVKLVCSMQKIVRRIGAKRPPENAPDLQRSTVDRVHQ